MRLIELSAGVAVGAGEATGLQTRDVGAGHTPHPRARKRRPRLLRDAHLASALLIAALSCLTGCPRLVTIAAQQDIASIDQALADFADYDSTRDGRTTLFQYGLGDPALPYQLSSDAGTHTTLHPPSPYSPWQRAAAATFPVGAYAFVNALQAYEGAVGFILDPNPALGTIDYSHPSGGGTLHNMGINLAFDNDRSARPWAHSRANILRLGATVAHADVSADGGIVYSQIAVNLAPPGTRFGITIIPSLYDSRTRSGITCSTGNEQNGLAVLSAPIDEPCFFRLCANSAAFAEEAHSDARRFCFEIDGDHFQAAINDYNAKPGPDLSTDISQYHVTDVGYLAEVYRPNGSTARSYLAGKVSDLRLELVDYTNYRLDLFRTLGTDQVETRYSSTSNGGWTPGWAALPLARPGAITSPPRAVSWAPGRYDLFANFGGRVFHNWYNASEGGWNLGPWEDIGTPQAAIAASAVPHASSWGSGRLNVFVRGSDNQLSMKFYDYQQPPYFTAWSPWETLPTAPDDLTSDPSAASWGTRRFDVVAHSNGQVMHVAFDGVRPWVPWDVLGAPAPGIDAGAVPSISSWGWGRLNVFVKARDERLYVKWFSIDPAPSWSPWVEVGAPPSGGPLSDPTAASWGQGRIDLLVTSNGAVWHRWFDLYQGGWVPAWENMGPVGGQTTAPAIATWTQPQ